jgi:hypothetical protein
MECEIFFPPIYLNFITISNYLFPAPYRYLLQYCHKNLVLFPHFNTHIIGLITISEHNTLKWLVYKWNHYLCLNVLAVNVYWINSINFSLLNLQRLQYNICLFKFNCISVSRYCKWPIVMGPVSSPRLSVCLNHVRHHQTYDARKISPFSDCSCFWLDPSDYFSLWVKLQLKRLKRRNIWYEAQIMDIGGDIKLT